MTTRRQVGVCIETTHVRLLDMFAYQRKISRSEIIRHAISNYIHSKCNKIDLDKEIKKVEELGESWERASAALWQKLEAQRELEEQQHRMHEDKIFESLSQV